MGDSKLCDNIFPEKSFCVHVPDIRQWLNFDPLSKIVYPDQQVPLIPCYFGEKAYDVQSPLTKGPRAGQWIENSSKLMNIWHKSLALITLLYILLCFILHIWLPITLCEGPVGQGSAPVWLPQIPSCNSSKSYSIALGCTHSKHRPEKDLLYNF